MIGLTTFEFRIPGVDTELRVHAETFEQAARLACDELGLHFLPEGTVTNQPSEAP